MKDIDENLIYKQFEGCSYDIMNDIKNYIKV